MIHEDLPCAHARERLSARLDGELDPGSEAGLMLREHLAHCGACRQHERQLAALGSAFEALREPEPLPDLWPALARRARTRPLPVLARVAAGLLGFLGLGGVALLVEGERAAPAQARHLLERLAPAQENGALFAALPEYHLLRALRALAPPAGDTR